MTLLEILILAFVQGLTEFLPVSSSGHLVIANSLLEWFGRAAAKDLIEVSIALHLGTLVAILGYYWREFVQLFGSRRHMIPQLVVGTIPAVFVGLLIKQAYPAALQNPLLAGLMFPGTALLLILAMRCHAGEDNCLDLSLWAALLIGLFQAFALLPGISRSGATIAAGIFVGQNRKSAATFAFLLAIPIIAGAGALETVEAFRSGTTGTPIALLAAGFAVSFLTGYAALSILIHIIAHGKLASFAWYLIPLGIAVIVWQLVA
ncbi:MAG: undecaprenyl-diphosphate phosphatase [Pirellulales bacterium]|nr:undecaprenyl-diphosphate phosphatase [Pirellulales bacterium]